MWSEQSVTRVRDGFSAVVITAMTVAGLLAPFVTVIVNPNNEVTETRRSQCPK